MFVHLPLPLVLRYLLKFNPLTETVNVLVVGFTKIVSSSKKPLRDHFIYFYRARMLLLHWEYEPNRINLDSFSKNRETRKNETSSRENMI